MKKTITILSTLGSLFMILDTMNVGHSLVLFLFVGVVPGTSLLISPIDMMAATATAFTVIVLRFTVWNYLRLRLFNKPELATVRKRTVRTI
jgi:hypothetical protein